MTRALPRETSRLVSRLASLTVSAWILAAGAPVGAEDAVVRSAHPLGPYLEVHLGAGAEISVLVPVAPACAGLARPERRVEWVRRGFPGRLEAGAESCEAAGILDLEAWRDRQPRGDQPFAPRKTARWEVIHRDGRRALLHGRFPLAGLVGMAGGHDLVAVVSDAGDCASVIAAHEGSLEYRASGPTAFRLLAGGSRCRVLGFARPLSDAATSFEPPPRGGEGAGEDAGAGVGEPPPEAP